MMLSGLFHTNNLIKTNSFLQPHYNVLPILSCKPFIAIFSKYVRFYVSLSI